MDKKALVTITGKISIRSGGEILPGLPSKIEKKTKKRFSEMPCSNEL